MVELRHKKAPALLITAEGMTEQIGPARWPNPTPNCISLTTGNGAASVNAHCPLPSSGVVPDHATVYRRAARTVCGHLLQRGARLILSGGTRSSEIGQRATLTGGGQSLAVAINATGSNQCSVSLSGAKITASGCVSTRSSIAALMDAARTTIAATDTAFGLLHRPLSQLNSFQRRSRIGAIAAGCVAGLFRLSTMSSRWQGAGRTVSPTFGLSATLATLASLTSGRLAPNPFSTQDERCADGRYGGLVVSVI